MNYRIFSMGHEFIGCAKVHYQPGHMTGPWEDSYQDECEIEVEEITMRLGTRTRPICFDRISEQAKDRIISEISEDAITAIKRGGSYDE